MAHCNTIVAQGLKLVPRHEFETLAKARHSGRSFHTASRWSQFVVLMIGQITGHHSLRDIIDGISTQTHRLYHLGSAKLTRSKLTHNNKPYTLYEALFGKLLRRCQGNLTGHGLRFKNPLYSLDASTIDSCLPVFPWADLRTTKGAIKLHVGLNHAGYLPEFVTITEGKTHDVTVGRTRAFPTGSIVVVDRGYNDCAWYKQLTEKGIFFVTRLKSNARTKVIERRSIPARKGLTCDQTIVFTGSQTARKCPIPLRRIGYRGPETGKHYVFLTNNFKLAAKSIADIYKARWQVELFFKWVKQNLKIKSFIGTSRNAVLTQIWIALCVYLLLAFLKFQSSLGRSLKQILRLLQLNLFEKRELMALLRGDPPATQQVNINQLALL